MGLSRRDKGLKYYDGVIGRWRTASSPGGHTERERERDTTARSFNCCLYNSLSVVVQCASFSMQCRPTAAYACMMYVRLP